MSVDDKHLSVASLRQDGKPLVGKGEGAAEREIVFI
jgi:hypothetical protein